LRIHVVGWAAPYVNEGVNSGRVTGDNVIVVFGKGLMAARTGLVFGQCDGLAIDESTETPTAGGGVFL
jgi:hypothetical protein